nr:fibropellin-1-like isoform X1 [Pocillopora verrucosa]XP_058969912.1 fibropellin-1-like isoform X1 [Pocillopora verrucosa]XP_058969918.1 fibropellin-1-like isoform X1 [Pocillopora verrucosa]XP_058969923.1 fibropellin-1-like isoform X1 [Pocillopora verrucosa]
MLRPLLRKTVPLLTGPCRTAGVSTLSRPTNFAGHHNNLTLGAKQSSFVKINKSLWHRAFSSAGGDLSGIWYNQFGSKMQIILLENGELIGFYVNCTPGSKAAREKLTGFVGKDEHASRFGFTVDFQNGRYTATWTGRCIKEGGADGEQVLLTNWIMTPNPEDGAQHLESIHIGQDRFTRKPQTPEKLPSFDDSQPESKGWMLCY